MINIESFQLNQNEKNSYNSIAKLKKYIDGAVAHKNFGFFIKKISSLINIDEQHVKLKLKKIFFNNFSFELNKFNNFNTYIRIFFQWFAFIYIFLKLFKRKKKTYRKKKKLILFGVEAFDQIEKFKRVLKKFNNFVLVTGNNFDLTSASTTEDYLKNNLIINAEKRLLSFSYKDNPLEKYNLKTEIVNERDWILNDKSLNNCFEIFKLGYFFFNYSLKNKFNFLLFLNIILFSYFKNYSIFSEYKSDVLIHDRIYLSCPIRNSLFKKFGGKISVCVQHQLTEPIISLFNDIDLFLTFGSEKSTKKILDKFGSNVKKIYAVGSPRLENYYYKSSSSFHFKEKIDILVIGVNFSGWYYANKNTRKNYYKYCSYIRDISIRYPFLKIYVKHHTSHKEDIREIDIFKNSSVKFLDEKKNSYSFLKNSKLILSFSSTMIQETYGIKRKNVYFVDPEQNNLLFFKDNSYLNKIKINSFKNLCRIVEKIFLKKKNIKYKIKKSNEICLKSKNVSSLIANKIFSEIKKNVNKKHRNF